MTWTTWATLPAEQPSARTVPARPALGDPVRIVIDDQIFEAYADTVTADHLTLLTGCGVMTSAAIPSTTGVRLEYLVDQDVWRLLGTLSFVRRDSVGTVWRFDFDHAAQLLLRRQYVRAALGLAVRLWTSDGALDSQTLDISGGGMRVPVAGQLVVGERVPFLLSLPGRRPIHGAAEAVRVDPSDGSVGLAFVTLSEADRTSLVLAVYDEQRRARRVERP